MKLLFRPRASILVLERLGAHAKGQSIDVWFCGSSEIGTVYLCRFHLDPSHPGKPAKRGAFLKSSMIFISAVVHISYAYIQHVLHVFQNCISRILFLQLSSKKSPYFSGVRTVSYTHHTPCPCPASPFLYPGLNGCVKHTCREPAWPSAVVFIHVPACSSYIFTWINLSIYRRIHARA